MARTSLLCILATARVAALKTQRDDAPIKTLRNGVVIPTIAAGTGGYDNQASTKTLRNGLVMPLMSAGTWQYDNDEAASSVQAALAAGFRHIDTAYDYYNQAGVSEGLAAAGLARKDVFITTKVPGCGVNGVNASDCLGSTAAFLQQDYSMLNSSYDLQGRVDLVLLHFPPCTVGKDGMTLCNVNKRISCSNCDAIKAQWSAAVKAYQKGLYRAIGVSNYCTQCLQCLKDFKVQPMVNQFQLHIGMGPDPQGFLAMNAARGIVSQAYSPIGSGGHGSSEILSGPLTTKLAKAHNKTTAQVALKYLVQLGAAVVTKSSSLEHLKQDVELFDWSLTRRDMKELAAATFASKDTPSFECDNSAATAMA
jgi:diketogulonate reductase-like aldo/keto reductase